MTRAAPPVVSVILPVHNGARFVAGAVESVLAQTCADWELLIVDDGSTDDTPAVLARFAADPRVTVTRQANTGLAGARNTGLQKARGQLLALLDADDEWLPPYLAAVAALAARRPDAVVFHGLARCMDAEGRDLPQVAGQPPGGSGDLYAALLRANFLIPSATVVRRAALDEAGPFDASLRSCEDWDMWLRLARTRPFAALPECWVRYRLHEASLSADAGGMERAAEAVIAKHFGPPEGDPANWPPDKRQGYGGLYRYLALLRLLRQGDWPACARFLRQGFGIYPALALDLDLFYELALGAQPAGLRGSARDLALPQNAAQVEMVLAEVFRAPAPEAARPQAFGTAYFALGLAAYNTSQFGLSRRCLWQALRHRPGLWRDRRVVGGLLKSLAGRRGLRVLKTLAGRRSSAPGAP